MYRMQWLAPDWRMLRDYFIAAGRQEAGAFLLVRWGRTASGGRLLVERVLLPPEDGLERAGHEFLRPSARWLSAVIGAAIEAKTGLAFIHSHPGSNHPPTLSAVDWETSVDWSRSITPTIDGPFASLVWSPRGMTGLVFQKSDPVKPTRLDRFESLGGGSIEPLHAANEQVNPDTRLDDRQIRALSALGNKRIRDLVVAVVGAGGTGSPLAEQLVRTGIAEVVLIDPDVIDHESNLRRVVGSHASDIVARRTKVEVVGRHLRSLGLGTAIKEVPRDTREEEVVRGLLDCDIVISTTDTQSSRALLNQIAYQYWLPIIDVGVRVGTKKNGVISGMPVEIRLLLPDNGCLWCRRGVLDSQAIYEENLPVEERRQLAAEGYVQGLDGPQPSLTSLNYLASAMAIVTLLRVYSGQPVPAASVVFDVWEQFVHPLRTEVDPGCICSQWRGHADDVSIAFLQKRK
jgi:molybdopterin-synthase adenylyltransferase